MFAIYSISLVKKLVTISLAPRILFKPTNQKGIPAKVAAIFSRWFLTFYWIGVDYRFLSCLMDRSSILKNFRAEFFQKVRS